MPSILDKLAGEVTETDIRRLITLSTPEGQRIEYKEELPAKNGKKARDGHIGAYAREEICKGVASFANANGGILLLGIGESKTKPPVAKTLPGIPAFREVEEKLKNILLDNFEPSIRTAVQGFPIAHGDDRGIVVIQVAASNRRPHGFGRPSALKFPIRLGDRTRYLTVREIQEMSVRSANWNDRLKRQLKQRSQSFRKAFDRLATPVEAFGFRMTAIPVGDDFDLGPVTSKGKLLATVRMPRVEVCFPDELGNTKLKGIPFLMPDKWPQWRPILRGARAEQTVPPRLARSQQPDYIAFQEIQSGGLLELGFLSVTELPNNTSVSWEYKEIPPPLWDDMLLQMLAELACWARNVRAGAGAPNAEYLINVGFRIVAKDGRIPGTGKVRLSSSRSQKRASAGLPAYDPKGQGFSFPEYHVSIGGNETVESLLRKFDDDLWNWVGMDISESLRDYSILIDRD